MGSGGMIVMDDKTCMVDIAKYFLNFLRDESCGKCVSCREGTQRMHEIVSKISDGLATMEDIMARWHRMKGEPTLWLPGIDHAGIATQFVVEQALAKEGKTRQQIGREKFLERVWQWKKKYGHNIAEQHKRLGASCDWSRERFTMDEGFSRAVRQVLSRSTRKG
jgi:hypothetical protein